MTYITLCFYIGPNWYDWIERLACWLGSRIRGRCVNGAPQRLDEVPDHVGSASGPRYWEAIARPGVRELDGDEARGAVSRAWRTVRIPVTFGQLNRFRAFMTNRVAARTRYSWVMIWLNVLAWFAPGRAQRIRLNWRCYDCSMLQWAALATAGVRVPESSDGPVTPNSLYLWAINYRDGWDRGKAAGQSDERALALAEIAGLQQCAVA